MTRSGLVALRRGSGITWELFLKRSTKTTPGLHDYPVNKLTEVKCLAKPIIARIHAAVLTIP
jgi:hypothetical protein